MTITRPAERYGDTRPPLFSPGRLAAVVLAVLALATIAALVYYVVQSSRSEKISGTQSGFERVDDQHLEIQFDVTRSEPATPVFCILRAKEYSGAEVGRREVYVPPGTDQTVRMETVVDTVGVPVAGDVYGCGPDVPEHLRR